MSTNELLQALKEDPLLVSSFQKRQIAEITRSSGIAARWSARRYHKAD
ncbi:MAG: hypothetical protein HY308_18685 [Gammaproteobacteria bacterium]|nr:hypothetical protein [Gammaproteobacteria bacterium]